MIDCLIGVIGLKGVNDDPTSSIYLNDFPGITSERFSLTREENEDNGIVDAWETVERKAIRDFETDLQFKLKKYNRT